LIVESKQGSVKLSVDSPFISLGQTAGKASEDQPWLESSSEAMLSVIDSARRAAATDATILLTGESGTGKNLLARQIHNWSERQHKPFVLINCTTLSENLLATELFGHVRGAFTGAVQDKRGRIEAAADGTVFLDEVAELSPRLQAKLLRFLEEQAFERVGGAESIKVDVRVIAATNRDLDNEMRSRSFRQDLYYRLNVISLLIPALRERPGDITMLAERFLESASIRNARPRLSLSPDAAESLKNYGWPGNIRELRNMIERLVVLSSSALVTKEDVSDLMQRSAHHTTQDSVDCTNLDLDDMEADLIRRAIAGSPTLHEAAKKLGIRVSNLIRKKRRYGV
jgi:NtrC-family two-component system response regulator AlgB